MGYLYGVTRTWLSPLIPTIASLLLAALWGFSVFAGWGLEAFCSDGESSQRCADRLAFVALVSSLFALAGGGATVMAWVLRHERLLMFGVAAWIAAEAVLFLGGMAAQ